MRLAAIFMLLLSAPDAFAETIRLKSGAAFEATIIEQNEREIVVEIPGLGREHIARSELLTAGNASEPAGDADLARWGIRLVPTPGWEKRPIEDDTEIAFAKRGVGILMFGRYSHATAAHELATLFLPGQKQPVTFAGVEGTMLTHDEKSPSGQSTRVRSYWLDQQEHAVVITCYGDRGHFEGVLAECDAALASFRFMDTP